MDKDYKKLYEEALKRAKELRRQVNANETILVNSDLDTIFPELKESEDEKIRKGLIKGLSAMRDIHKHQTFSDDAININDAIAWLENQKTIDILDEEERNFAEDVDAIRKMCDESYQRGYNEGRRIEKEIWLEKQGEQKPEEWCFPYNVNETVDKLMAIAECLEMDEDFLYNGYTGTECVKFLRDLARKQVECTPTDEIKPKFKVGDWIVQKNIGVYKVIEICKSWYEVIDFEENHYSISFDNEHMCHLWTIEDAKDGDVLALDWKDEWYWQKIVIFKSFNECGVEGYGNTFKNNKLAFVEDVPYYSKTWSKYLHPATKEQRDLLFQKMKEAGYEWDAEKKELKKIEQEPSWSEEDEDSLDIAIRIIQNGGDDCAGILDSNKAINWLKSLKDRVQPQPKQEWSKEDNKNLNSVIWVIENSENLNSVFETINSPEYIKKYFINWLKSLKPQTHWKPSDKQLESLKNFVVGRRDALYELYLDLEKLKYNKL